jgi:hypothetical protein
MMGNAMGGGNNYPPAPGGYNQFQNSNVSNQGFNANQGFNNQL